MRLHCLLIVVRGEIARCDTFRRLINELPTCNRLLLSWMIVHMTHVIQRVGVTCNILQRVGVTCNVIQRVGVTCNVLLKGNCYM